ncbi:hypothetical protein BVRB_5g112350 [Beta vulgaris subsp. vulgaris]|nr:hypothetical protein BVRB_5g112350 [Beta vulgaris subsp. vulgaris]
MTARDAGGGNRPATAVYLRSSGGGGTTGAATTRETEERASESEREREEAATGCDGLRRGSPARNGCDFAGQKAVLRRRYLETKVEGGRMVIGGFVDRKLGEGTSRR